MRKSYVLAAVVAVVAATFTTTATYGTLIQTVNVQLMPTAITPNFTGLAAAPDAAGGAAIWNHLTTAPTIPLTALNNSFGNPSGISLSSGSGATGFGGFDGNLGFGPVALLQGYFWWVPASQTPLLTISGLNPGYTYDLYVYGSKTWAGSRGTAVHVTDNTGSQLLQTDGVVINSGTPFDTPDKIHVWNSITGLIPITGPNTITMLGDVASPDWVLNGFQLTEAVPEPSTVLLFLFGGVVIYVGWNRRHHRLA